MTAVDIEVSEHGTLTLTLAQQVKDGRAREASLLLQIETLRKSVTSLSAALENSQAREREVERSLADLMEDAQVLRADAKAARTLAARLAGTLDAIGRVTLPGSVARGIADDTLRGLTASEIAIAKGGAS